MFERMPKIRNLLGMGLLHGLFGLMWLWTLLALWYLSPLTQWTRVVLALVWLVGVPLATGSRGHLTKAAVLVMGIVVVVIVGAFQEPRYIETPIPNQAQIPYAQIKEDEVTIHGVRNSQYDDEGRAIPRWETRQYRLDKLQTLDFMIVPFGPGQVMAHTMLSFGFEDDAYLVVSVEIERKPGYGFNPVAGMYRQFLLRYVIGTERDLVGLRCNVAKDPVRLYPIKAGPEKVRKLFLCMLERATRLRDEPEFYNTITNNCTTNIVKHYELLVGKKLAFDWRILLPAYTDDVAKELGLIAANVTLQETREANTINDRCLPDTEEEKAWSMAIRAKTGVQRSKVRKVERY